MVNADSRLDAILKTAVEGIITIDDRGTIDSINPAGEKLFGYTADELIGRNVSTLMPSPYRDEHDGYMANYRHTGVKKIIGIGREVIGKRKDGTQFPMDLSVSEFKVADKRMFAGFVRDLTERHRSEEIVQSLGRIVEESLNEIFIVDSETLSSTRSKNEHHRPRSLSSPATLTLKVASLLSERASQTTLSNPLTRMHFGPASFESKSFAMRNDESCRQSDLRPLVK